jgi:sugar lactone lactonase YvrE
MKKLLLIFTVAFFGSCTKKQTTTSISIAGIITTIAGNDTGTVKILGDGGLAINATIMPQGVAVDGSGNIYIADFGNSRIRKVNPSGIISTIAGNGVTGYGGDGGEATDAALNQPVSVAIDGSGNVYIADYRNSRIRKVNTSGIISTIAGGGTNSLAGGGAATEVALYSPCGVAVDGAGNVYIAEEFSNSIYKVNSLGIISTFAGNGFGTITGGVNIGGYSGDGGAATAAELNQPQSIAIDGSGNVYIADYGNSRIRKVNPSGIISTFAGNGTLGYSGDGGAATAAELSLPICITTDSKGNVYIEDSSRIRKVNPSGIISTIAGNGTMGYSGDGGAATAAELSPSPGLAVDGSGNVYIDNDVEVRKVSY